MTSDSIAYCGLCCSECPNHTGVIADLARDLRKELRTYRFEKTAELLSSISFFKSFEKYHECYEVLGSMVKLRCGKYCKEGGGNPGCRIRNCAKKNQFEGCWECESFESCDKLEFLETNHGRAHLKNLKIIKRKGIDEFLKGKKFWYAAK
ncbi:MAG: DUF3795 domain-containing protein [Melioribacteraceae bacterium]|nr:DUF3795 domain-containing protein [Melioribacteraceae bacterium]MCF8353017.1 DUF3795 domain-containing protein [Melioribacteraceae bacterium]MCF8392908.1 DUF3795 domain-containing protein [Melioribacteraceae bacterium]MCF8417798.1 DUF3795 domain-containing protein [Melioribacteraceae bacterium]